MSYVDISFPRLVTSAVLVVVAALLSRRARLGLEGDLLWGALRGAVQLVAVGYALLLLFRNQRAWVVAAMLAVMWLVAAATSARRVEHGPGLRALFPRALVAIGAGALAALVPMFGWIVPVHPWYEAHYLVPISGMMLGNAMNVVALTFERIFAAAHEGVGEVEALLSLGATPQQALHRQVRTALRSALTPTINSMLTVGLVSLPGMMTGQIVSGTAPDQAVRYQIVILYQLVVVAAVAGVVSAMFARRLLFNSRGMLVLPEAGHRG